MARSFALVSLVPAVIVVGLLIVVVFLSFHEDGAPGEAGTMRNYMALFSSSQILSVLWNTVVYVGVTAAVALVAGTLLAIIVERTDFGFARSVSTLILLRILIPSFFTAMGWLFLLHPRIGVFNVWLQHLFGLQQGPLSIVSVGGMGFIEGLSLSGLVFMMVSGSLRNIDGSFEESARTAGAGPIRVLRLVTLPLVSPALLSSLMFVITIALSGLDVPLVIGLSNRIYVFSTYLYLASSPADGVTNYGVPAAFSAILVVIGLAMSIWYLRALRSGSRFQVVAGKGYRPTRARLSGSFRALAAVFVIGYFLLSMVLPMLMVIWVSLLQYLQVPSFQALKYVSLQNYLQLDWPTLLRSLWNTLELVVVAPTVALALSLALAFVIVRSRMRSRFTFDLVAFLPQTIPTTIFAFSAMVVSMYFLRGWLYGGLALIAIVMALTQIAFGTRTVSTALVQIHPELEESAAMSGGGSWQAMWRVTLPLLRPTLLYSWVWLAMLVMRDLTVPAMLAAPGSMTLSFYSWSLFNGNEVGQSSAVTVLWILVMAPFVAVFLLVSRKNEGTLSL